MTPYLPEVIATLEAALEAGPTPGPWIAEGESSRAVYETWFIGAKHPECGFVSHAEVRSGCDEADELGSIKANVEWITAANPTAIRTLLDALRESAKDAEGLREVGAALLFVTRAMATELGIDPETTEFRFSANREHIATFTLASCYERADSTLNPKD